MPSIIFDKLDEVTLEIGALFDFYEVLLLVFLLFLLNRNT